MGLLLAGSVFLLNGCAPIPPEGVTPGLKTVEQYETRDSFKAPQRNWPAEDWWTAYHDSQLDALVEEGLANSPSMTVAAARFRHAQAMTGVAASALYPQAYGEAQAGTQKISQNYSLPPSSPLMAHMDSALWDLISIGNWTFSAKTGLHWKPPFLQKKPRRRTSLRHA
ncbi:MAG: hypothetical protein KIG68_08865 [Oxalobacter sp.]|nr:hypothetical protein [Oxalobacter sp.]